MQDTEQAAAAEECAHRWLIDSPNGPTSMGRCRVCGAEGEFKNSVPMSGWDRNGSRAKKNKGGASTRS